MMGLMSRLQAVSVFKMQESRTIANVVYLPARVMAWLVSVVLLAACATSVPVDTRPPPLLLPWSDKPVDDVDVLALSPEMESFLEKYILPYDNLDTKLHLLTLAISNSGVLGFDYDETRTLTAKEAFHSRTGNCIGFSNMMVALARRAGLEATYQEVLMQPEWLSREEAVLLVQHINVVLSSHHRSYVVDLSGYRIEDEALRQVMSDLKAKVLYYNNLGAEALLRDELGLAFAHLTRAIELSPSNTEPWVNLGLVYARNDQLADAEFAFKTALDIDPGADSAMSNLYEVYIAREKYQAADAMFAKVDRYRRKNPYYLMMLGEEERALGRYEESISLLTSAIRKKQDDHLLHFELAKSQYLQGEIEAAEISLSKARQLAPSEWMAMYDKPLEVLVTEE